MKTYWKLIVFVGGPALLCVVSGIVVVVWGLGLYKDEVCEKLVTFPELIARTGAKPSCSLDYGRSMALSDFDTFVFDVKGATGEGRVFVESVSTLDSEKETYKGILFVSETEEILLEGAKPKLR